MPGTLRCAVRRSSRDSAISDALKKSALSLLKNRRIAYNEQHIIRAEQRQAFVTRFKLKEAPAPAITTGPTSWSGSAPMRGTSCSLRSRLPAPGNR
ncbi:MAG TPA: hypothetical protein VIO81_07625 [Methyloversatilis sp.]